EVVRQQWNFSPDGSRSEEEIYHLDFPGLTTLELEITPDIGSDQGIASIDYLALG
ncbi:MAG: carbohydrate-binding protein, partial [Gammaproteobacteria bacterium]|nr:carbohydrate-binding protein [Gammaproteobacteria bacterium]